MFGRGVGGMKVWGGGGGGEGGLVGRWEVGGMGGGGRGGGGSGRGEFGGDVRCKGGWWDPGWWGEGRHPRDLTY